ncbi:MAG: SHOCT domain-containing protein [Flintibacter sp.]|uniref:SHOCT domain-containing protein n=1 Tax=Flintibacter sp. TaxID=1918624 RepID=UPI002D7EDDEB|nr:SHOCT domain-containing protein [Flintibacter sp.]MCI7160150.1 SHOCT domain-containing protein [Flintibacter sp.]
MRRRRVTYRPSKAQGAFGVAVGCIFVLIGLFMVIPVFGLFGILWTLVAVGITGMNAYQAFGKNYTGPEITIEEDEEPRRGASSSPAPQTHDHIPSTSLDVKGRLEQLKDMKEAGLLSQEEYDKKRQEILKGL